MTLYNPEVVKDNCGFGLIAHLTGEASHKLVRTAISSLARMAHRVLTMADGRIVGEQVNAQRLPARELRW